jgi:branched-chain amino acid transport system substrate-binding protein
MKNRKTFLVCCVLLVLIITTSVLFGCTSSTPATTPSTPSTTPSTPSGEAKTLQIGALLSVTGFFSSREVPDYNELLILVDMINADGGITINGQKYNIEIVLEDCKSTMDGVTAAANKLVFDKNIKLIVGPTAFFAAAASPVCDPNKALRSLSWCTNSPQECDESTPYSFLGCNASVAEVMAGSKFLRQTYPDVKKLVVVNPDDGAQPFLMPIVERILEDEGFEILDIIYYPNELQDFSSIAAKINSYSDADATYQSNGLGPHVGAIVKGLRELGNDNPYASALPTSLKEIMVIAGTEATKDVFSCAISPDAELAPLAKEICNKTVAEYGEDYSLYLTAADALWDMKEAMVAAQSLDPTAIKDKWETMDTMDTIFGKGYLGGQELFGINHAMSHSQAVMVWKDGQAIFGGNVDIGRIP